MPAGSVKVAVQACLPAGELGFLGELSVERAARVGETRAIPMSEGEVRAAHVNPKTPRLMVRWEGYQWSAVGLAKDFAAAQRIVHPDQSPSLPLPGGPVPHKKPGRHRKPPAQ
ncbi:DUF6087 family protein [Streptomyces sp. NPDC091259]|uniref:DUF6087 family protein n=1 Tax=Streptomyces sp. NPDC091259 TaxID=3365976 RepID=UPI0037FF384C